MQAKSATSALLSANLPALSDQMRVHICVTNLEQFSLAVGQLEQQLQWARAAESRVV